MTIWRIMEGFACDASGKELTCQCKRHKKHGFSPWEDPLEEKMATHSSVLAWRIPWTEEPGRLWSIGSQRVSHDRSNLAQHMDPFSYLPLLMLLLLQLLRPRVGGCRPWGKGLGLSSQTLLSTVPTNIHGALKTLGALPGNS